MAAAVEAEVVSWVHKRGVQGEIKLTPIIYKQTESIYKSSRVSILYLFATIR